MKGRVGYSGGEKKGRVGYSGGEKKRRVGYSGGENGKLGTVEERMKG